MYWRSAVHSNSSSCQKKKESFSFPRKMAALKRSHKFSLPVEGEFVVPWRGIIISISSLLVLSLEPPPPPPLPPTNHQILWDKAFHSSSSFPPSFSLIHRKRERERGKKRRKVSFCQMAKLLFFPNSVTKQVSKHANERSHSSNFDSPPADASALQP